MTLELKMNFPVIDFQNKCPAIIPKGIHEIERITPDGLSIPWLVLKGTTTGFSENVWSSFYGSLWGILEVKVRE